MTTTTLTCAACNTTNRVPTERVGDHPKCGKCKQPILQGHPLELTAGNVAGIARVDDRLTVLRSAAVTPSAGAAATAPGPGVTVAQESSGSDTGWSSRTYTVQKGDTLSGIAKEMYGDAGKYQQIFQANQPMLKDPDRIYPGQVLRIPAQS